MTEFPDEHLSGRKDASQKRAHQPPLEYIDADLRKLSIHPIPGRDDAFTFTIEWLNASFLVVTQSDGSVKNYALDGKTDLREVLSNPDCIDQKLQGLEEIDNPVDAAHLKLLSEMPSSNTLHEQSSSWLKRYYEFAEVIQSSLERFETDSDALIDELEELPGGKGDRFGRYKRDHMVELAKRTPEAAKLAGLDPRSTLLALYCRRTHDIGRTTQVMESLETGEPLDPKKSKEHAEMSVKFLDEHALLSSMHPTDADCIRSTIRAHVARELTEVFDPGSVEYKIADELQEGDRLDLLGKFNPKDPEWVLSQIIKWYRPTFSDELSDKLEFAKVGHDEEFMEVALEAIRKVTDPKYEPVGEVEEGIATIMRSMPTRDNEGKPLLEIWHNHDQMSYASLPFQDNFSNYAICVASFTYGLTHPFSVEHQLSFEAVHDNLSYLKDLIGGDEGEAFLQTYVTWAAEKTGLTEDVVREKLNF